MKKTAISLLTLFFVAFTALGQSVTITPTTDKQLTLTAAGVAVPNITGQRSNGTSAAPTALPNGAWMMSIYGRGYNGSGYSTNASSAITFGAAQDFTPTANGSNIQFYTTPLNSVTPAERMRIDHNGNVGIGIDTPVAPLDVNNSTTSMTAKFNGAGSKMFLTLFENGAYRGYLGSYSGATEDVDFGTGAGNATGKLHLTTQAVPRLTIAPSGNVGIRTTNPNAPLQFANSLADRKIVMYEQQNNDNQFTGFGVGNGFLRYQLPNTTDFHGFYAGTSPTTSDELMRIQGNGNVGIGTSTFATGEKFAVSNGIRQFGIMPGIMGMSPTQTGLLSIARPCGFRVKFRCLVR
ncbi:MAG: hypothetical protein R2822_25250 [Spirosomataceae bacterium]